MSTIAHEHSTVRWASELVVPDLGEFARAIKDGWLHDGIEGWDARIVGPGRVRFDPIPNLVTTSGIDIRSRRLAAVGGPPAALTKMGVDAADITNVDPTAGTSSSGTNKKTIIAFDSTPTYASPVMTYLGTYTQANVNFIMKRLFLTNTAATLTNSATADDALSLHSMTNRFTIDLTTFATWSQTFSATVTGTGS